MGRSIERGASTCTLINPTRTTTNQVTPSAFGRLSQIKNDVIDYSIIEVNYAKSLNWEIQEKIQSQS